MKDEIKEILDFKEDADYKRLSIDEITTLRDYITNLQEENERLKKELEQQNIETGLEVERLKNRINNTVEYINNPSYFDGSYMTKHDLLMLLSGTIVKEHSIRDMKKIKEQLQELKGSDKE